MSKNNTKGMKISEIRQRTYEQYLSIIRLKDNGMNHKQMAEEIGISTQTLRTRMKILKRCNYKPKTPFEIDKCNQERTVKQDDERLDNRCLLRLKRHWGMWDKQQLIDATVDGILPITNNGKCVNASIDRMLCRWMGVESTRKLSQASIDKMIEKLEIHGYTCVKS